MKNKILAVVFFVATPAFSAGIPVVDAVGNAQFAMETAQNAIRFQQELQQSITQYNELINQGDFYADMVNGHWNIEEIFNQPDFVKNIATANWQDAFDAIDPSSLRSAYGLESVIPEVQAKFDNFIKQNEMLKTMYEQSFDRQARIENLHSQMSSATTPAQKDDLANAIKYEQMQIQNDAQILDNMNKLIAHELKLEVERRAANYSNAVFN
ncbi:type IV secretion system protein [Thaumasiovibrio subtropicus]|uniref:type IV secretion system protein n=1 Tax=Thaumasiovibrio subtropicus TaxID=1891207 RepID=UPI000B34BF38|nr:type IV secretion system protein [Thaumasiovibrio subtropicus]